MKRVFCSETRRKAVWGPKRTLLAVLVLVVGTATAAWADGHPAKHGKPNPWGGPNRFVKNYKMDAELRSRAKDAEKRRGLETTRVIIEYEDGADASKEVRGLGQLGRRLDLINGQVIEVRNVQLKKLARAPGVLRLHYDRPAQTHNYRTGVTVGARAVKDYFGYTGAGVGIAIIDSGIASWHDDLTNRSWWTLYPYGNQRVSKFVDFVNGQSMPYDDNGHGTHVAGIIGGNGYDSFGEKSGIAPNASLVSLKVLDQDGRGTISNIIAALDWVAKNAPYYNVRVVNLSVGAGVYESYWTDPLTLAAKKVTDKGITVVAAAGNFGKNSDGQLQWGAITAPGNAPWVLTVGASSTMGTLTRSDDQMADYSSSGPTAVDFLAKPDLVAPGTGTVSLSSPGSTLYISKALNLVTGSLSLSYKPYLALSGTSMAAPVVSGTVALMLQANPNLTPNLIKAILQYTSERYPGYSPLRQGAGFLNTYGAVRLARFYATARTGDTMPSASTWSRQIIWGNHQLSGGVINPSSNAWATNIVWGMAKTMMDTGDNIVWGMACGDSCDNIVWGMWGGDNIVWGMHYDGDNIVWGMSKDGDNIVWGMDCGGADCDDVIWGSAGDGDNIVWGMAEPGDNIVWGMTRDGDNIVWGMGKDGDNIVWGMGKGGDNIVWGMSSGDEPDVVYPDDATEPLPDVSIEFGETPSPTQSSSSTGGGL